MKEYHLIISIICTIIESLLQVEHVCITQWDKFQFMTKHVFTCRCALIMYVGKSIDDDDNDDDDDNNNN